MQINIRLNEEDFQHLIQGGELRTKQEGVTINMILADIGYVDMNKLLVEAARRPDRVNNVRDFNEVRSHGK